MKPACVRANMLLQQRAAGLSQAEGLRLEEHLARCEACRQAANLLSGLRSLQQTVTPELSEDARRRAITQALAAAPLAATSGGRAARGLRASWPALASLAACAALALFAVRSHQQQASGALAGDRVLAGSLESDGRTHSSGALLTTQTALRSQHGARIALAHAIVDVRPATQLAWDAAQRSLRLDAGSVSVDVDPSQHRSFSVVTPRFTVRVLGTQFEVGLGAVKVLRGRVQVQAGANAAPIILDAAGRTEFVSDARTAADAAPNSAPAPSAAIETPAAASGGDAAAHVPATIEPAAPKARDAAAHVGPATIEPAASKVGDAAAHIGPATIKTAAPKVGDAAAHIGPATIKTAAPEVGDAARLLDRARAEIAAHAVPTARQTLRGALALKPARAQQAEAHSLLAECSLVAGDYAAASAAYLRVAARFPQLPAAESALFAAARIEAEHGDLRRADALFARYLARYPQGSFAREAHKRRQSANPAP